MIRRVHLCMGHTGSTGGNRGAVHVSPAFETFDETPIIFADRERGTSKINSGEAVSALWIIFRLGIRNWTGL